MPVAYEVAELDLSHLHEAVRPIAGLPAAERLGYIRADRSIGYPAANEALQRLETLLAWPASSGCRTCSWSARRTTASR